MAISFKDIQGTVGIGWDTLTEGSYQVMGDENTQAQNGFVAAAGTFTGARRLRLLYPPNAASQGSFSGMTVFVLNATQGGNNVEVETQAGGGVVNVTPGSTAAFYLDGTSLQYTTIFNY